MPAVAAIEQGELEIENEELQFLNFACLYGNLKAIKYFISKASEKEVLEKSLESECPMHQAIHGG